MSLFTSIDANSGALTLDGAAAQLFRLNAVTGEATSDVLPWFWARALTKTVRKMLSFTTAGERKTLDFVSLLISAVDADGGADSALSVAVLGDVATVSVSAPAGSTVLLSIQRTGGSVKPVVPAAPASAGSVNLAPYALKTELPSIAGLLSESNAVATYATKAALAEVAGFVPDRTLFVAKNGNDSMGNGSYGKPFLTIGKALEAANSVASGYVRINVAPGQYGENVTVTRARTVLAGSGVDPEDHTTEISGALTVDCAAATQRFNDVVAVSGIFVTNGAKVTGTGAFTTVFTDCYLTTTNAAVNALLVDGTHADRQVVYLRNCTVTKQGSASTDVVKLSKGDVRIDTVRVYGATGTGHGILLNNNASLTADRLQVDHNMSGSGIRVDGSFAGVALTLSNSSLKSASPALYLKNDTGIGALLWQVMLLSGTAVPAAGFAIDGVANATPAVTPTLIYSNITAGPNNSAAMGAGMVAKLKLSDLA